LSFFERMKMSLTRAILVMMLGGVSFASAYGQGTSSTDLQLPEPDKFELEKVISSPGEGNSKYIYKAVRDPKDSLAVSNTSNSTTNTTTGAVTKIRAEKAIAPSTKETVGKQSKNQEDPSSAKAKNQDDSILSFNFLYYIIEKYKLQDIVD
jgi:hypothetical protein